jgi:hypothetical protein
MTLSQNVLNKLTNSGEETWQFLLYSNNWRICLHGWSLTLAIVRVSYNLYSPSSHYTSLAPILFCKSLFPLRNLPYNFLTTYQQADFSSLSSSYRLQRDSEHQLGDETESEAGMVNHYLSNGAILSSSRLTDSKTQSCGLFSGSCRVDHFRTGLYGLWDPYSALDTSGRGQVAWKHRIGFGESYFYVMYKRNLF